MVHADLGSVNLARSSARIFEPSEVPGMWTMKAPVQSRAFDWCLASLENVESIKLVRHISIRTFWAQETLLGPDVGVGRRRRGSESRTTLFELVGGGAGIQARLFRPERLWAHT